MENAFDNNYLRKALRSEYEIIAIWSAYQILRLPNDEIIDFLPDFLQSPFPDIQDAGISTVSDLGSTDFLPEITKIFRETDGQVKYSAAFVLAQFPNDFSKSLIHRWFEELSRSDQATRMEFEASTYAYINIDHENNFKNVVGALIDSQEDAIKSSVLFLNLLMFCETAEEYQDILDQYFILRDINSDAELTLQIIESFGEPELSAWWEENLSRGYTINSIYEQCFILLDIKESISDRQFWTELEKGFEPGDRFHKNIPENPTLFLTSLCKWIDFLVIKNPALSKFSWICHGFLKNSNSFLNTIPKILEMEYHFLLTIPLIILLEESVKNWLENPQKHVEQIANYYHSSLLITKYREKILRLFFPTVPQWNDDQLKITQSGTPFDSSSRKHEIIWMFYRGELLGYDLAWPSYFPNPNYSIHLAEGLCQIYFVNFEYFINKKDRVSIDYALQLFQASPQKRFIQLLIHHFDYLSHFHTETLYQTIEYLPDPAFKDLLLARYQAEEIEIARLIFIICEIFSLDIPAEIKKDIEWVQRSDPENTNVKKPIRLHCDQCNNTFQYIVNAVYVDEGSILRMNRLSSDSVWVPQSFKCKKCDAPVSFVLDETQLNEFSLQSRVNRILKSSPQSANTPIGQKIILIDFPRYKSKTYTPDTFQTLVESLEKAGITSQEELTQLWIKQARLFKSTRNWEECEKVLKKIPDSPSNQEELYYLKGLVSYKLNNFAAARHNFDMVSDLHESNLLSEERSTFYDESKYFLKTMNSISNKRSRLKLVSRK